MVAGPDWAKRFDPSRLRELRNRRGLSQEQLAKLIGQERVTVVKYENGRRSPRTPTLYAIAEALEVDVTELLHPGPVDLPVLRLRRNLSQTEVAAALGVSQAWYQRIEAREVKIDSSVLRRLARILHVDEKAVAKLVLVHPDA